MSIPLKYNVRSLLQRKSRAILTILGMAAVVAVFVAMLALSRGMTARFAAVGSPDNVVVLQRGAFSDALSSIPASSRDVVPYLPQLARKADVALASPEVVVEPWASAPGLEEDAFIRVRGVEPVYFDVEDTVRITAGTADLRGNGVLVGRAAREELGGVAVGESIGMFGEAWVVKGLFEALGTGLENVVLADLSDVMRAADRTEYSAWTLKLADPAAADEAIRLLEDDRRVLLSAARQRDHWAAAGKPYAGVSQIGLLIALVVTLGAVFGGMNTMYTAVAGRLREIGTLRSIGFSGNAVLLSFLVESVLLSATGGVLGALLGRLVAGLRVNVGPASIPFAVGADVMLGGVALSVAIGLLGGYLPARAAARATILQAMRRA